MLFAGDCKMAALQTRARIAGGGDYYLTPLPNTGETAKQFDSWIDTALRKDVDAGLQTIHKPNEPEGPEVIATGYEFDRTLQAQVDDRDVTWTERVQVVQSASQLNCRKAKLESWLRKAEGEIGRLTLSGKGRKIWRDEQELRGAITVIEQAHGVEGLLAVGLSRETQEKKKYRKPGRPRDTAVAEVEVEVRYRISGVKRNGEKIEEKQKRLGWRAFVTNAPKERLSLAGSVLTYREGGGLERPFHQLKGAPLGIRPLFVRLPEQIVGLTRLLLIALRVLTLLEIVLRAKLAETGERLEGMHEGQKNRKEGKPTGKRMLRAIAGLEMTVSLIRVGQRQWWYLPALPRLLIRVLDLLGLSPSLYTNLTDSCPRPAALAPSIPVPSG